MIFCCNNTATTEIYTYGHTLSLHDALPIYPATHAAPRGLLLHRVAEPHALYAPGNVQPPRQHFSGSMVSRSEEHTSELQSLMRISYAVFCLKTKTNISYLNIISPITYSTQHPHCHFIHFLIIILINS